MMHFMLQSTDLPCLHLQRIPHDDGLVMQAIRALRTVFNNTDLHISTIRVLQ